MSRRVEQLNKHLQRTFGEVLQREATLPVDSFVTIARVDTTANLKSAIVWLYVQPLTMAEEVLTVLTEQLYDLQGSLNRKLDLRPLPRIRLMIDYGAEHAAKIEATLKNLD